MSSQAHGHDVYLGEPVKSNSLDAKIVILGSSGTLHEPTPLVVLPRKKGKIPHAIAISHIRLTFSDI